MIFFFKDFTFHARSPSFGLILAFSTIKCEFLWNRICVWHECGCVRSCILMHPNSNELHPVHIRLFSLYQFFLCLSILTMKSNTYSRIARLCLSLAWHWVCRQFVNRCVLCINKLKNWTVDMPLCVSLCVKCEMKYASKYNGVVEKWRENLHAWHTLLKWSACT